MDEIQAQKPALPDDDRVQDRPAGRELSFNLANEKPVRRAAESGEGTIRLTVCRAIVYSLLVVPILFLSRRPLGYVGPLHPFLAAFICWGGSILFGLLGWLSTFDRFNPGQPRRGSLDEDNPFKKKRSPWPAVLVGGVAALIWGYVLFWIVFES